jgi:hypothetical protein
MRNILGRRQFIPLQRLFSLLKKGRIDHMILLEDKVVKDGMETIIS